MKPILLANLLLLAACSANDGVGTDAGLNSGSSATCGNGTCDENESSSTCSADCPPPVCGDDTCDSTESQTTCSQDCGVPCGNNVCDPGETIATCSNDCKPVCGNNTCEVGETISTCAADCQTAACTVGDPNSCSGETVCIANKCENAFGRNYRIKIERAVFPPKDANGDPWDGIAALPGLPDGKAKLTVNGVAFSTPVVNETLTPTWNYLTPTVLIPAGTNLAIAVVDYDGGSLVDDTGWDCVANPLAAAIIRGGGRCSGTGPMTGAYVTFQFIPL